MKPIVQCVNLTKRYKDLVALDNVNFTIPENIGIVGLLGPNGSGKTTLIKLIMGLLTANSGSLYVAGREIGAETKSVVSYLSDAHSLNESYTVEEEVEYYADFFLDFDKDKAWRMIEELSVNKTQKVKALSKGTKEKLSLILTLSRNAKLFVLDEPIAGVDPAAREYILQTIFAHRNQNSTIIISTHLISEIEQYFDYVLFLKEGKIVLEGKADDIREREKQSIDALFREVFKWM